MYQKIIFFFFLASLFTQQVSSMTKKPNKVTTITFQDITKLPPMSIEKALKEVETLKGYDKKIINIIIKQWAEKIICNEIGNLIYKFCSKSLYPSIKIDLENKLKKLKKEYQDQNSDKILITSDAKLLVVILDKITLISHLEGKTKIIKEVKRSSILDPYILVVYIDENFIKGNLYKGNDQNFKKHFDFGIKEEQGIGKTQLVTSNSVLFVTGDNINGLKEIDYLEISTNTKKALFTYNVSNVTLDFFVKKNQVFFLYTYYDLKKIIKLTTCDIKDLSKNKDHKMEKEVWIIEGNYRGTMTKDKNHVLIEFECNNNIIYSLVEKKFFDLKEWEVKPVERVSSFYNDKNYLILHDEEAIKIYEKSFRNRNFLAKKVDKKICFINKIIPLHNSSFYIGLLDVDTDKKEKTFFLLMISSVISLYILNKIKSHQLKA